MARRFTIEMINGFSESRIGANPAINLWDFQNQYQFFRKRPYEESLVPEPFSRTRECKRTANSRKTGNFSSVLIEDAIEFCFCTVNLTIFKPKF